MKPEGHLVTAAGAAALAYGMTGSGELAAGVFTGGFLIDVDHYVDYVLIERQYSLDPFRFIRYYLDNQARRLVLVLHSYELMALLALAAAVTGSTVLWGYLIGAAMHLWLDIRYNGSLARPWAFYSFWHRLRRRFLSQRLLVPSPGEPPARAAAAEQAA